MGVLCTDKRLKTVYAIFLVKMLTRTLSNPIRSMQIYSKFMLWLNMSSNKQVEKNKKRKSEDKLCERGIHNQYII